jgi:hypothetical protein
MILRMHLLHSPANSISQIFRYVLIRQLQVPLFSFLVPAAESNLAPR